MPTRVTTHVRCGGCSHVLCGAVVSAPPPAPMDGPRKRTRANLEVGVAGPQPPRREVIDEVGPAEALPSTGPGAIHGCHRHRGTRGLLLATRRASPARRGVRWRG